MPRHPDGIEKYTATTSGKKAKRNDGVVKSTLTFSNVKTHLMAVYGAAKTAFTIPALTHGLVEFAGHEVSSGVVEVKTVNRVQVFFPVAKRRV